MLGPAGPFPDCSLRDPLERRWLHYAFLSRRRGQAVIANLSTLGAETAGQEPQSMAILLLHDDELGWSASQFNATRPQTPWSAFRVPSSVGERFSVASRGGAPAVDLLLRRTSRPCTSQCAKFGRHEHLRWQSEPGVLGTGGLHLPAGRREVDLLGYHERVRGRWSWPALGGWVFGFANDPAGTGDGPPPAAVVFTLIQPRGGQDAVNGSVMLWREGRLVRHFPRRGLEVVVHDVLDRDQVVLVPPLARSLGTGPTAGVPRRLVIVARMGRDRLVLDFTARTAARIANPCELGIRPFSVHETLGTCRVDGLVSSNRFGFAAQGIVEFAGGAGTETDRTPFDRCDAGGVGTGGGT
jgi:hypothetical protein